MMSSSYHTLISSEWKYHPHIGMGWIGLCLAKVTIWCFIGLLHSWSIKTCTLTCKHDIPLCEFFAANIQDKCLTCLVREVLNICLTSDYLTDLIIAFFGRYTSLEEAVLVVIAASNMPSSCNRTSAFPSIVCFSVLCWTQAECSRVGFNTYMVVYIKPGL